MTPNLDFILTDLAGISGLIYIAYTAGRVSMLPRGKRRQSLIRAIPFMIAAATVTIPFILALPFAQAR